MCEMSVIGDQMQAAISATEIPVDPTVFQGRDGKFRQSQQGEL